MSYPSFDELKERIKKREERKKELAEALKKEKAMDVDDYQIDKDIPIDFSERSNSATFLARKLLTKMKPGYSFVTADLTIVSAIRREAEGGDNVVTTKKEENGWRVWIL